MKALKVKISGEVEKANKEIVDYELEGIIPFCNEEVAHSVCVNRYAKMWLRQKKITYSKFRTCYLDDFEEEDHKFSLVGKDIREMSEEELQDLAVLKGLRGVRLYKEFSPRESRLTAYQEYTLNYMEDFRRENGGYKKAYQKVMKEVTMDKFNKLKPIIIKDDTKVENKVEEVSEVKNVIEKDPITAPKSLADLKMIADDNDIEYHTNIGENKLRERLEEAGIEI